MNTARTCRACGCTDLHACPGGCYWVSLDLCSACAKRGGGERSPLSILTRKSQVLAVIKAGGKVRSGQRARLWMLLDKNGQEVPAWQTAIKGAVSHLARNKGRRITARAVTDEAGHLLPGDMQ